MVVEEEGREESSVYFTYSCSFFFIVEGYGIKGRRKEKHQLMEGGVSKNYKGKILNCHSPPPPPPLHNYDSSLSAKSIIIVLLCFFWGSLMHCIFSLVELKSTRFGLSWVFSRQTTLKTLLSSELLNTVTKITSVAKYQKVTFHSLKYTPLLGR